MSCPSCTRMFTFFDFFSITIYWLYSFFNPTFCYFWDIWFLVTTFTYLSFTIFLFSFISFLFSLYLVSTWKTVQNYNKKSNLKKLLHTKINYKISNSSTWLIHVNIPNAGHLLTQCWQGKYKLLGNINIFQNKRAHTEWVNANLEEIKYK